MFRKNTAGQFIHVQGVDATTGGIKSGVTWTVRRCIDGTFAAATGTATEDGTTGWYKLALSQADTNGDNIGFSFTGSGAVPQTINIVTTACDPTSSIFGLSDLTAIKAKTDGLPAAPASVSDIPTAIENAAAVWDEVVTDYATPASAATYLKNTHAHAEAIQTKTDLLPAAPAGVDDIPTALQNADALLNRDMASVSDTNARSPLNALRFLRNKRATAGTAMNVYKENDSTVAWTAFVETNTAAKPIVTVDPS